jgi:hypothetical protein
MASNKAFGTVIGGIEISLTQTGFDRFNVEYGMQVVPNRYKDN